LDDWGLITERTGIFPLTTTDQLWGSPSLLSNRYWGALSPGVKWLGHEADHLAPSSAEDKNAWSCMSS